MADTAFPPQEQHTQPGKEYLMDPEPNSAPLSKGCEKLKGKVAIVTGGDSGIGRAVARAFAREKADVAIVFLDEDKDAKATQQMVEKEGVKCLLIRQDLRLPEASDLVVRAVTDGLGKIDILVNNQAEQHKATSIEEITEEQLISTFKTNFFGYFFLTKAVLPNLKTGSSIINTTSVTAYKGNPMLIDYSSTKGAIVSFTRSLAASLAQKGIRVNGVAPGPIWTPLIPSSFPPEQVANFGKDVPLGRAGQPNEVAPCFVFLASEESSYITGQILHPNGGVAVSS